MLKRLVNEASFPFTIKNLGPLLIKSGYAEVSGYDMEPVQTYRNGKLEYYIPGSSLKGVLRSHFERIARTINT
ncbi:MAG: CRISPR-associated protein, partial [Firmicutes bacterium]|nr:CRISPR-associated protein [Bacillota bacterium]